MRSNIVLGIALSGFATAGVACEIPALVVIPDAEELAGQEERVQDAAARYFTEMEAYVECVRTQIEEAGGEDAPDLVRNALIQRNNVAVAEAEVVADWYDETLAQTDADDSR